LPSIGCAVGGMSKTLSVRPSEGGGS